MTQTSYPTLPPITVSLQNVLPKTREAFDNKTLQMFQEDARSARASYSGPCAIGCALPEIARRVLDESQSYTSIDYLAQSGLVVIPQGQLKDLNRLQQLHDNVFAWRVCKSPQEDIDRRVKEFENFLIQLEEKYLSRETPQ